MPRLLAALACLAACTPGGALTTSEPPATDTTVIESTSTATAPPTTSSSSATTGPTTPPVPGRWRGMLRVTFGWGDYFEDCESGEEWPVQNPLTSGLCETDPLMLEIEGTLVVDDPDWPGTSVIVTAVLAGPCTGGSCDEPWSACHDSDFETACMQLPDCDPFAQDCPEGQKCAPFDSGSGTWDNTRCVPVVPNPKQPGEPCSAPEGPTSGIDDCAEGSTCREVDADTLLGTCVAQCVGSYAMPACDDPNKLCIIAYSNALTLCLPSCDPLEPDCPPDKACLPIESQFVCIRDHSGAEGQIFDSCEQLNECDPGLLCANPALADECDPMVAGCCLPFCDLDTWECPGAGQECLPWYEADAPAGLEDLGVCGIPL